MFRAVFRCDASPAIGGGHVMRCLTLANQLGALGWRCAFATAADTITSLPHLATSGHEIAVISEPADPEALMRNWQSADLAVIDHYHLAAGYESKLRPWARRILAIDDFPSRPHSAEFLLDQTFGRNASDYAALHSGDFLLGSDFALLRPDFRAARPAALARRDGRPVSRILIAFGAIDAGNATADAVSAATAALPDVALDIVLGSSAPHLAPVRRQAAALRDARVHVDVQDMATLMLSADLAIGAPGTSAWERCALGLPSLLLIIADNQQSNAHALYAAGAAVVAGRHEACPVPVLAERLAAISADSAGRRAMAMRAAGLCDGLGALRTALGLLAPEKARDGRDVRLRAADSSDASIMLKWQQDPETRRFARNPAIPKEDEHIAWVSRKLSDPACIFTVIEHADEAAGIVRLDRVNHLPLGYEISILIAPEKRGLKTASAALRLARNLAPGAELVAEVLPGNEASVRLFQQAGYRRASDGLFHAPPAIH